jgi:hypothetical protein
MVSRLLVCYKKLHLKGWSFLLNLYSLEKIPALRNLCLSASLR